MATQTIIRPWNWNSEVRVCATCDGLGVIHSPRRPSIDDPYPMSRCPDCSGEHLPECAVCGFDQQVKGYDCLACDTIASLSDDDLKAFSPVKFAAALLHAMNARRAA